MNFEQFSKKYKSIKSPVEKTGKSSENSDFINYLSDEEKASKRKYQKMYILYGIGAIAYLFVFVINPDADLSLFDRLAGICFILAFSLLFLITRNRFFELSKASFLQTPKQFLSLTKRRHVFWNRGQMWLIPVLLLVNFGATLSLFNKFENIETLPGILLIQVVFWGLMIFAYFRGKRSWEKNKKPILLKIDKMLAAFDEQ